MPVKAHLMTFDLTIRKKLCSPDGRQSARHSLALRTMNKPDMLLIWTDLSVHLFVEKRQVFLGCRHVCLKKNLQRPHCIKVYLAKCLNSFPNPSWSLRVWSISFLKTRWEKKKLLVTSNFFFSRSVFYPFREPSAIFIKFEIVVCKLFQFGRV